MTRSTAMFDPLSLYVTGETAEEAFASTLVSNYLPLVGPEDLQLSFEAWKRYILSGGDDSHRSGLFDQYVHGLEISWVFRSHRFCITTRGLMCLLPAMCAKGDVIVIFTGCPVPYVLRKRGNFFELIGHCYVHGFMDGEGSARKNSCGSSRKPGAQTILARSRTPQWKARQFP